MPHLSPVRTFSRAAVSQLLSGYLESNEAKELVAYLCGSEGQYIHSYTGWDHLITHAHTQLHRQYPTIGTLVHTISAVEVLSVASAPSPAPAVTRPQRGEETVTFPLHDALSILMRRRLGRRRHEMVGVSQMVARVRGTLDAVPWGSIPDGDFSLANRYIRLAHPMLPFGDSAPYGTNVVREWVRMMEHMYGSSICVHVPIMQDESEDEEIVIGVESASEDEVAAADQYVIGRWYN